MGVELGLMDYIEDPGRGSTTDEYIGELQLSWVKGR